MLTLGLGITVGILGLLFITTLVLAIVYGVKYTNEKKAKDELQANYDTCSKKKCPTCPTCPTCPEDLTEKLETCIASLAESKDNYEKCDSKLTICNAKTCPTCPVCPAEKVCPPENVCPVDKTAELTKCNTDFTAYKTANPATCSPALTKCNADYIACDGKLKTCVTPTAAPATPPTAPVPVPPALDSYVFIQGYDLVGTDVFTAARSDIANNPAELSKVCSATSGCQGFNTNGWFKKAIVPNSQKAWAKWTTEANKGSYILKSLVATHAPTAAPAPAPAFISYRFPEVSNYCLDITSGKLEDGVYVNAGGCNTSPSQLFYLDSNTKHLKAKHSGKCVTAGTTSGSIATQSTCKTDAKQRWNKVSNTDGTFTLKNEDNSLCLTAADRNWSNVTITPCTNSKYQKFKN